MIHEGSSGRASMLLNMEAGCYEAEETAWQQEVECLFKIELQDGKREQICKKAPLARGSIGGGKGGYCECNRCARNGHIRSDCGAKLHVSGGQPIEFKNKLNNFEENEASVELEVQDSQDCLSGP